ncbi:MAG: family N-acetyltransferase [Paucimonas sp.]|nr:family N-acetyltransferase [Paucimonas sp.]
MKDRNLVASWNQQYDVAGAGSLKTEWRDGADTVSVACYENYVPPAVEAEIASLYGSLYSSLPLLREYGAIDGKVSTCVMARNGATEAIFLFRVQSSVLTVLNEGMPVDAAQMRNFARFIFARYPTVSVLRLHSVQWQAASALAYPHQRYRCLENIVLTLPDSAQAYHASLGKNTRRNLKRYGERLLRDFPDYAYTVKEGSAVDEADVRAVIALNVARMASKNKTSAYDAAETERLVRLARECGLVGVGRIGSRVVAGAISFRTGDNFALSVLAHDPAWNDYSLGILCAYHIICDCIERGGREFHFLWGRYDYKFILLARERQLEKVILYRSWLQMLLHIDIFIRNEVDAMRLRGTEWLQHLAKKETFAARFGLRVLNGLRTAKRLLKH